MLICNVILQYILKPKLLATFQTNVFQQIIMQCYNMTCQDLSISQLPAPTHTVVYKAEIMEPYHLNH